jgi:acetamidase/formamidase
MVDSLPLFRQARCPASLIAATKTNTMAVDVCVRQVCVGTWPIVACGTSTGDVIATDLEDYEGDGMMGGRVMGCAMGAHRSSSSSRMMMM